MTPVNRKKIAVLGGGPGSLTSVFEITSDPNWKEKYESITVYQMGWRLGGKCASGRRPPHGQIEEHGLHIWLGFYNNSFDVIQKAYGIMDRPAGSPLATWQDAFKQHSYIVLAQSFQNKWYPWEFNFPTNSQVPGKGAPLPTLWEFIGMVLKWLHEHHQKSDVTSLVKTSADPEAHEGVWDWIKNFIQHLVLDIDIAGMSLAEGLLKTVIDVFERLDKNPDNHTADDHDPILKLLDELNKWLRRELVKEAETNLEALRFVILMDMGFTMITGLLKDGVLTHPDKLDSIDNLDLREWLTKHGALDITTASPLMKGLYDLVFANVDGKPGIANSDFAAGTAIRCIFRILGTYKGSVFWKMQGGMGDTVFTPLHKALVKRGVTFKFFHKIKNLCLSEDGKSIGKIVMGKQATVKAGDDAYDPYVNVLDLECWPSDPHYDQLIEGDALKNQKINLESFYAPWKDQDITLEAGKDFDDVIFGISLGSIPFLCSELINANSDWKNMVDNIKTVRTMSFQVWLNKNLEELGWETESPVMDAYVDPMNTWADMSQLIPRETWPASANIKNVSYFCGPMEGGIPPPSETNEPDIALATVKEASQAFLENNSNTWWPKDVDAQKKFDQSSVVDVFYRANIDPSERYVLSVKNSTQFRLHGGKSGFSNLYLAGDWTHNGLNAGCVEACTMSGKIVSNAMTGFPALSEIDGLEDK